MFCDVVVVIVVAVVIVMVVVVDVVIAVVVVIVVFVVIVIVMVIFVVLVKVHSWAMGTRLFSPLSLFISYFTINSQLIFVRFNGLND